MSSTIHVIDLTDYKKIVGLRPFVALPKEEIDRLYASIEIHTVNKEKAEADFQKIPLSLFTVIHFNYSWFTCHYTRDNRDDLRSLGFTDLVLPGNFNGLFLDETLSNEANRILQNKITIQSGYTLRLSGLLFNETDLPPGPQLAVLYVARLRQTNSIVAGSSVHDIIYHNNGELQQHRDLFDPWSKIIIDHLVAL